ncbi:prenyltransferase/squalene oxidase repeat-containing protein [Paenibacillus beijingensis]|uniref:Squalene-hopene cyclase n=1 Tax=Paenibacillus beijingensis TaxID=1126833 RepID=A0A0D5NL07_9BACL|nr:prenyltransferase/squalene oxidase repeat-containing protein [Paenibacillus beijingensis]AJY75946.1 hypothetical protein VN24_17045 [Paenibacillus beijingensis]
MIVLRNQVRQMKETLVRELLNSQSGDGSWRLCFEGGITSDAYLIVLLCSLKDPDPGLIRKLAARIASRQEPGGGWKLYRDQPDGQLEATVEAYYALLYSGYYDPDHPAMEQARSFILARGGLCRVRTLLTQALLCMTGQAEWPGSLRIPVETLLAPLWFPVNLFDLSGHARVHLVPILMIASTGFALHSGETPDLSGLFVGGERSFDDDASLPPSLSALFKGLSSASFLLHKPSLRKAELFLLERIEPDGTLLTYSTATMLMIAALLSIGYEAGSDIIQRALAGIKSLVWQWERDHTAHLQVASSALWDTAMIGCSLRDAAGGLESGPLRDEADRAVRRAADYVAQRQHNRKGDWSIRNPYTPPGGFGFSDVNTLYPDVDDTMAALHLLRPFAKTDANLRRQWERGLAWVLSMQNPDGGWPAFEKESDSPLLGFLQFESAAHIVTDPSTVDLTARTLHVLSKGDPAGASIAPGAAGAAAKAARWLLERQLQDGSWFGRWGICYVHGTGAALSGLSAIRAGGRASAVARGTRWLLSVQHPDGGWGESCASDAAGKYVPLQGSTPSQTAWALEALIAVHSAPTASIDNGIVRLIELLQAEDWRSSYPTGGGLAGSLYIHYHSSRYIWPLRVLAMYERRYGSPL